MIDNRAHPELMLESAVRVMQALGMEPDPWQLEALAGGHKRLLLNCCRQAGKSTTVAVMSLLEAVGNPATKVLLLSRSFRQAQELFRQVLDYHRLLGSKFLVSKTADELQLSNFSRILCLPCKGETIRGYSNVGLLVIDEAARVPDDIYRTVRPMLAVSDGRLVCLSTPYGKRGFFYNAWARGGDDWARIEVAAERIGRIKPEWLAEERRELGESWFRQEYCRPRAGDLRERATEGGSAPGGAQPSAGDERRMSDAWQRSFPSTREKAQRVFCRPRRGCKSCWLGQKARRPAAREARAHRSLQFVHPEPPMQEKSEENVSSR